MPGKRNRSVLLSAGLPWWVGVALAAASWVGIAHVLPDVLAGLPVAGRQLGIVMDRLAWAPATAAAAFFLLWALASWREGRRKRRLLDTRTGVASIRSLSWREFEELVAEAFRREGYRVEENAKSGADGGVDIRLRRNGRLCGRGRGLAAGVCLAGAGQLRRARNDEEVLVGTRYMGKPVAK